MVIQPWDFRTTITFVTNKQCVTVLLAQCMLFVVWNTPSPYLREEGRNMDTKPI